MKHDSDRTLVISLGRNGRASYPERPWEDIEPVLRRMWEFDSRLRAWQDVRAEVQAAWRASDDLVPPRARRALERSRAA
ncbi:MAG: hypothetical protein ACJ8GV_09700 [Luteimonas sp.]